MHIEVQQGMQKLASNRTRKLFSEEIDWTLNRMVEKFITSAITENRFGYYEINERYAQAIAPLKEVGVQVQANVAGTNLYAVQMPADFRYMVSPGVIVGVACENQAPGQMSRVTSTQNLYGWDLRTQKTTPQFWAAFSFVFTGGSLTNANLPGWTGYKTIKEQYQFANVLQEMLWTLGINAYYETYGNLYYPGMLIVPGATTPFSAVSIDGNLVPATTLKTTVIENDNAMYLRTQPGRIMRGSVNHNMRVTPYFNTTWESPLLEESQMGHLQVYADNTYTVRGLEATYLRKPRKIDLSLRRGCDLHPSYHKIICNMAIQDALEQVASPQWTQKVQVDNLPQPL